MRIVVALGGNALLRRGERPDAAIQRKHVAEVAPALAKVARDHELVVVHGNGPQVGMLAMESDADPALSAPYPLSDLVAETQGLIGLWLQQEMVNAGSRQVACLITQTVVDPGDPAFDTPSKFIGPLYDEETAADLARRHDWTIRRDGTGWRRVVASPKPQRIVEIAIAEALLKTGVDVVLGGGGGVPVVDTLEGMRSVQAVVDKDHVAAMCAEVLEADLFVVLTDVPAVMTDFGTDHQRSIGNVTAEVLEQLDFPAGSMGPKVQACCHFVRTTGRRAAIGALDELALVISGKAGTQIVLESTPELRRLVEVH
ncbi:MAG TPA: carbamate kinase [Nocardioidaceae bacterium]|nr:carbamate kinase [Nocardioidaceae bacterium]